MSNVARNPSAPVSARKSGQKAERTPEAAREENEQTQRAQKVWARLHRDAENHILGVVSTAAEQVSQKGPRRPDSLSRAAKDAAYLSVLNVAKLAVEAAVAKVAGFETWAELEEAEEAWDRVIAGEEERDGFFDGGDICEPE